MQEWDGDPGAIRTRGPQIRNPRKRHPRGANALRLAANERPAEYRRFTCLRDLPPWRGPARHFLAPTDHCAKARWTDGKPYCPHQGLQLAQFWDGKTETIRCPLHGLLIDMCRI